MFPRRIEKVQKILKENKIEAFLLTQLENVKYLTGLGAENSLLLITPEGGFFFVGGCHFYQARAEVKQLKVEPLHSFENWIRRWKVKKLYFEKAAFSYQRYQNLKDELKLTRLYPSSLLENLRVKKEKEEIHQIKKAVEITDLGFEYLLDFLKPGLTEQEVVRELEYFVKKKGGEKNSFDFIVAGGPRAAYPHLEPGKKKLRKGEMVIVDFGVRYNGYNSDLTRTVFLGKADRKFKRIYQRVLAAQEKAIEKVKPGVSCRWLDQLTREYLKKYRLGKYFVHNLGHGVGLAIHEPPYLSSKSKEELKQNSIITVEPGVYLPGWGGVRIEDIVQVTAKGGKILTTAEKKLIEL
jgi:Xaa-Pro aminopeptidase